VTVLEAHGVVKRYGRTEALAGVDLELHDGELFGLLGHNGAGKSTLVKLACGLVRPNQDGLRQLTAHIDGTTGAIVKLGPFGGAQDFGVLLGPYAVAYLAGMTALGIALFKRRDL
jgi:ABC-type branched-subunit amino acid transport system ATPase component